MRISIQGSLRLRPKAAIKKKSMPKGARRKSEIESTGESNPLILISTTMKAQFKGGARGGIRRKLPVDLAEKKSLTVNHEGKGLTERSLFTKALDVRIMTK